MTQAEELTLTTQPAEEMQEDNQKGIESFDRPLSVRDRIRLMNRDASASTPNNNGAANGFDIAQHQDQLQQQQQQQQQHQPLSSTTSRNKRFFPPTTPNSTSIKMSHDDSSFNFVQRTVAKKESNKHRQDILSDPGVGSKSDCQSAAAAITKWRKRRSIEKVGVNNDSMNGLGGNGDKNSNEQELDTLVSPLSDTHEKPEWTISDLTRQKKINRKTIESHQNDVHQKECKDLSNESSTMNFPVRERSHEVFYGKSIENTLNNINVPNSEAENVQNSLRNEINNEYETCLNEDVEQSASAPISIISRTEDNKSEGGFLGNVKLKSVSTVNRNTFGKQSESGTFVIPKLRPVRKAPHTLAIIMQQTKKQATEVEDQNDESNRNEESIQGGAEYCENRHTQIVGASHPNATKPITTAPQKIDSNEQVDSNQNKSSNNPNSSRNKCNSNTASKKKENTPPRPKVSDRIKAFGSVYSGINQSKCKPSVPTPPKRMKVKKSFMRYGPPVDEDASLDSSERITIHSHDDDSISVLTPMNYSNTPARLGAQPPTPNSYNSEAAYTAASSGDGAVAGSISSKHKQQLQMRYAKFDTPDVSHDGDNMSVNTSSIVMEEQLSVAAIKNSLQSKLEQDKKKAVRKRAAPNHVKVPSVLIAAQKKAQDLKPQWGDSFEAAEETPTSKLLSGPMEDKSDVKKDLSGLFDCEQSIGSKKSSVTCDENVESSISASKQMSNCMIAQNDVNEEKDVTSKDFSKLNADEEKESPISMFSSSVPLSCEINEKQRDNKPKSNKQLNHSVHASISRPKDDMFPEDELDCMTENHEQNILLPNQSIVKTSVKDVEVTETKTTSTKENPVISETKRTVLFNGEKDQTTGPRTQELKPALNKELKDDRVPEKVNPTSDQKSNDLLSLEIKNTTSGDSQTTTSTQSSRLAKADAVKKLIKRRRQRNKNKVMKADDSRRKNKDDVEVSSKNNLNQRGLENKKEIARDESQHRFENKKETARDNSVRRKENISSRILHSSMSTINKTLNNHIRRTPTNVKANVENKSSIEDQNSKLSSKKQSPQIPNGKTDSHKPKNLMNRRKEKSPSVSKLEQKVSSDILTKDNVLDPEDDQDSSGFIPMKSNASKDRRSRFMKATSIKRKMLTQSKTQDSSKSHSLATGANSSLQKTKNEEADELPILPPSIVRSIKDDKNLESIIDQKPDLKVCEKSTASKSTTWCLDSDNEISTAKLDDEPEPIIESFIHADLSPIKSVNQSKHIFETNTPYYGSPDCYKSIDQSKESTPPAKSPSLEIQRQSTPRRRNRIANSDIICSSNSECGSQISQAVSAPIYSDFEKKYKNISIPDLTSKHVSKMFKQSKASDNLSEASSSVRSTASARFSSRVNKVLASRSKMNVPKNKFEKDLATNLAREMLEDIKKDHKDTDDDECLEIYDEGDPVSYPTQDLRGEHNETERKQHNKISDVTTNGTEKANADLRNQSTSSEEDGYLDITDGQISVDLDELMANEQDNKENKEQESQDTSIHNITVDSNNLKCNTSISSQLSHKKTKMKGSWFTENVVDLAIEKLAADIVSNCDGVDLAAAEHIAKHMPYCGGDPGNVSSIAPESLNASSMSAVRISNEESPSSDQNQQEGFEVEYIPTELVDSISEEHQKDPENSILMHFNSKTSGSIPLKSNESFFDLSMNDTSLQSNNESSEFSTGRSYYRRKY